MAANRRVPAATTMDDRRDARPHMAWWNTRWCLAGLVILSLAPLMLPAMPPLLDLPGHMGRYRVMLGTDPGLAQWYDFHWQAVGYLGADLLVLALSPITGLEPAVKLVVIAIALLATTGILWTSREAHGRVQPLALAALPLVYNFAFHWGFLNYTLSMALTLNAFALWLRLGRLERWRLRAVLFVPIACGIWVAHLFGWIALCVVVFGAECARQGISKTGLLRRLWMAGLNCLPLALPMLMFFIWWPTDGNAESDYVANLRLKPIWLITTLRDRWKWLDIGSSILIAVLLYGAIRQASRQIAVPLVFATFGLLLLYVALPFGSAYLDARLAPYVLIMALLVPSANAMTARASGTLAFVCLSFFLGRTAATTTSLALNARDWDRHLVAIEHIPHGARVAAFVTNPCPRPWAVDRLNHLPSFAIVRRGAFTNDQFDLGNTALLKVTAPGLGRYAIDPSQIVTETACAPGIATLADALRGLPRTRFDYVWLIDPPARRDPRLTAGMTPVWSDGRDLLLRIAR